VGLRYNLSIIDSDEKYVIKLMGYVNHLKDSQFHVSAFTQVEGFIAYEADHKTDAIVCSSEYADDVKKLPNARGIDIVILTKDKQADVTECPHVYKYQSALDVYKEIVFSCKKLRMSEGAKGLAIDTGIIGIIPIYNQENTFYLGALLADCLGRTCKTLYISFDAFFNDSIYGNDSECMSITEGFSYLGQNEEHGKKALSKLIFAAENNDVMGGCTHYADCTEMSGEDAVMLVERLRTVDAYKKIIIDFGGFNNMTGALIKYCDRCYVPLPVNQYERERLKVFLRQSELSNGDIRNKMEHVPIPEGRILASNGSTMSELRESGLYKVVTNIIDV